MRFLRISFLDFFPAIFTGSFALIAALSKQPRIALVDGRGHPGLADADDLAAHDAEGDPPRPAPEPGGDGRHGRRAARRASTTSARPTPTARRSAASRRRPSGAAPRRSATTSRCRCSAAARRSTRALFHLVVIAFAVYLFVQRSIGYGDIMMFSILFLNVMSPLNEVHRFIDEAHESSLRMGDLLEMLAEPTDRSFQPSEVREPRLEARRPAVRHRGAAGRRTARPAAGPSAPRRGLDVDPARRDDRRGGPFRAAASRPGSA